MKPRVEQLLAEVNGAVSFARDWRNRHISHTDLQLALGSNAKPLKAASRQHVDAALDSIATVLNSVALYYKDATVAYKVTWNHSGAEVMLSLLRDGINADRALQRRLENGELLAQDFERQDPI